MQGVDREQFNQIIKDSNRRLTRLKLLADFFQNVDLISIMIRTNLIHQTFNDSTELDINKLELFHLQFTDSLIELFQKIKKAKEQQIIIVKKEIVLNTEYIDKIRLTKSSDNFEQERKFYNATVSVTLRKLYTYLAENRSDDFDWNEMASFTYKYRSSYYRILNTEQFRQVTDSGQASMSYQKSYVTIERKLLGKLNKQQFKVRFLCGMQYHNTTLELFSIFQDDELFLYHVEERKFFLVDETMLKGMDINMNTSRQSNLVKELTERNVSLNCELEHIKQDLKDEQKKLLDDYLNTISTVDFLTQLQNVDEQTNILRTMLNLNINP
ncbi:hypothetical protein D3C72_617640 [compost metagenome]